MKIITWIGLFVCVQTALAADTITTLTGSDSGSLKEWKAGKTIDVVDNDGEVLRRVAKEEFISWQAASVNVNQDKRIFVGLTNGVGVQAWVEEWMKDGVVLRHPMFGEGQKKLRKFVYEDIHIMMFLDRVPGTKKERLLQEIRSTKMGEDDMLFLKNDHLRGLLISVGRNVLQFDKDDETKKFKMSEVSALVLANTLVESKHDLLLVTNEGFEFPISSFKEVEGNIEIDTALGPFKIKKNHISRLTYSPRNRLFLGNLIPSKTKEHYPGEEPDEYYPYTYNVNRTVVNEYHLSAGKRKWTQGIGVHSYSELTWGLPEGSKSLAGAVAIDNEAQGEGSVHFRIYTDGKKVFDSGLMTGKDEAKYFKVDLSDKKTVTLEVVTDPDKKEKDFTRDRADWLDLILTLK